MVRTVAKCGPAGLAVLFVRQRLVGIGMKIGIIRVVTDRGWGCGSGSNGVTL